MTDKEYEAAWSYLLRLSYVAKVSIQSEAGMVTIDVTKGAMQQWHATGETFAKAVSNLRLMRGD